MTQTGVIINREVGRKRKITRAEMAKLLLLLHADGLKLGNAFNVESNGAPGIAAESWAQRVRRGLCVVSAAIGEYLRDGNVRYDQPGSIDPMRRAHVMFIAESLSRETSWDVAGFVRRHADRTLIVKD